MHRRGMHMEWCVQECGVMCMHGQASKRSLDILVVLLLLEWTSIFPLCCCGRDC